MKKNIFLILGLLISCNLLAADVDHGTKTICEDQAKPQFKTTNTGDEYIWSKKNGNTWTQVATGSQTYTPTSAGEYQCEVKKNPVTTSTGNLLQLGGFEFSANNRKDSHQDANGNWIIYEYSNWDGSGVNINYGATTTNTNPQNVKNPYFINMGPHGGSYMLICDGSDQQIEVWKARGLSLPSGDYEFSCWAANVDAYHTTPTHTTPQLKFRIIANYNQSNQIDLTSSTSFGNNFMEVSRTTWREYKVTITLTQNYNNVAIIIVNETEGNEGNDFALDDIYFGTTRSTSGSKKTEIFKLEIDTKPVITMPVIEDKCPNISVSITPTVTNAGSSPSYTWTGDSNARAKDISITSAATVGDTKECTLEVKNGQCKTTESITIKTKDCGRTETIDHPAVTVCTNQNVTLTCNKTGSSVKWSHDASLADTEITVTSSSTVGDANSYTCTITATENGSTVTYIENFTVKSKECSILYESTMCNTSVDSTLTTQKKGDKYIWTLPDGNIKEAVLDNIKISHIDANVGDKFAYSCEIYELPASNPNPSAPIAMLIATENFEITITDCHEETEEEKEVQVKEDGSIKLVIPSENRCTDCIYNWYKKDENGKKGEPVVKNIDEEDWEHTVHNAKEEDYVCEIIKPNGNIHEQSYKVRVYVPKTSKYCYTKDSENEQYVTIDDLTVADRDEYEWYLIQGNDTIPMPEAAIVSTENQKITLDVDYFVNNNSKFPVTVHILEEFAHKLQVESTEIEGGNNSTDVTPEPEPTPETPIAPAPDPSIAPENRSLKFRNLADENEGIVDEDGDGFVMWKDEHILSIYPNSSQTLVEVSSPNKEHETEVKLPNGEKVKFTYYPSMFQEGMTQYTESATREDEHGCKHTVNFTLNLVELEPDLYFSPNDDGVHDKWMVKGIETAPNAHIMIYDRHSKLLYKTVASEFEGWDGEYNGHGMVQDDYWYVILVPETNETLSGHFTLKR